jgi:putative membrane protein
MPMWTWMSGWAWVGMTVMLVILLALVVVATVVVVRLLGSREQPGAGSRSVPRSAMEILEERIASGEINEDEFKRRRGLLSPTDR